jgi:hypothetical protein
MFRFLPTNEVGPVAEAGGRKRWSVEALRCDFNSGLSWGRELRARARDHEALTFTRRARLRRFAFALRTDGDEFCGGKQYASRLDMVQRGFQIYPAKQRVVQPP